MVSPRQAHSLADLPPEIGTTGRLLIPVLGASGGCGRSTTAGLLASALAATATCVVLDTAPRLVSPWPSSSGSAAGLAAVPPDQPLNRRQVRGAAAPGLAGADEAWQVLTDHRAWDRAPLDLPGDPAAWYQLAAVGGWQLVVADTSHLVAHDIVTARWQGRTSLSAAWCALPYAVPVLCAAATGAGIDALHNAAAAFTAEGLPLQRTIVALAATGSGRRAAAVRAAVTMLRPRVGEVVELPFDPHVSGRGLCAAGQVSGRTGEAARRLAHAVLASAHRTWGTPLPTAPSAIRLPKPVPRPVQEVPVR